MPVTNSSAATGKAAAAAPLWLGSYPSGVPHQITLESGPHTLGELLEDSFRCFAERTMYSFMGTELTYAEVERLSAQLGAYLQSLGLEKGARAALMLPNIPQYPIAAAAILRSGFVLVNVNPLYTGRELEHQLNDSQARVIVVFETAAATLQKCIKRTGIRDVIVCAIGDMLPQPKAALVNFVLRRVKKRVPSFKLDNAIRFPEALRRADGRRLHPAKTRPEDIAVLQYTGGTTGGGEGGSASAPQPRGQCFAMRRLAAARAGQYAGDRATNISMRAAALSHLCLRRELPAVRTRRRKECAYPRSAQFQSGPDGVSATQNPFLSRSKHAVCDVHG